MMTCPHATLDAAYVLGSLSPVERADYERHLAGCEECTRAVGELAGLPGLLAKVPADVLEPTGSAAPVPESLLPRLVAEVRRDQRRRTTRAALLAAAAVAVIAGPAVAVVALDGDETPEASAPVTVPTTVRTTETPSEPSTAPSERLDDVGSTGSTGWVSLTEVPWGTRLDLTCEYRVPYGYATDSVYSLVVRTTDGDVEEVATFQAVTGEELHVTGATAATPDAITAVEVQTSAGDAILRLRP